ncbi:MAG TPA: polyprenyl synthetase family protein [Bryobacteraceae bacterium]|nr:polyprenyl synthetase family protein [Bryobacteraceae bacterium]HOL72750.1 polyprenyl synthetase family protein [Bryobacteraceae bacterium]HOQ45770.1 polyprenyl synthetase family protein [Bryobacteraceae bacterium]HPQ14106.1 polyprenyl synthetase family protein [Bryobacteraceae bacterium]HPU71503.1 polyprenyl synthetase family protein [Bryobacteraceae bacterium]
MAVRDIIGLIDEELSRVEREISLEWMASVDAITMIGNYLRSSGGKRLRPALVILTSKLVGDGGESAIRLGAVVEMIHSATLVHDDVIDGARTRRGRASTNIMWGNHTAVLAGDWLYMQAFQIALRERDFRVLDLLINVTQSMVEGELLQLKYLGSMTVTEAEYMDLVDRKTAGLFSVAARLGAVVAGADPATEEKLGEYAWNVGMAFQLIDDVLDFTAHESVLGKPVGNDLWEGKVTLPLIYALESSDEADRNMVATVLADRSYERVPFERILDLIIRRGGVERVRQRARAFTEKARSIIGEFPESPYQRALYAVTELVTERDY